jgi:hypothetical protein
LINHRVLRTAKATAAERSQTLKEFMTEAVRDKLSAGHQRAGAPAWMQGLGKLKHLREETARVQAVIDEEFDVVQPEDRSRSSTPILA